MSHPDASQSPPQDEGRELVKTLDDLSIISDQARSILQELERAGDDTAGQIRRSLDAIRSATERIADRYGPPSGASAHPTHPR